MTGSKNECQQQETQVDLLSAITLTMSSCTISHAAVVNGGWAYVSAYYLFILIVIDIHKIHVIIANFQNLENGNLRESNVQLVNKLTWGLIAYHLPLKVMTAQLLPSLSVSFSTLVENDMALIIPSPNFSFKIALYA